VVKGQRKKLPGKFSLSLSKGDVIVSKPPGEEAGGKEADRLTTDISAGQEVRIRS